MNKIVFHNLYRYGSITKLEKGIARCSFYEEGYKDIVSSYLKKVDDRLVSYIDDQGYEKHIKSYLKNDGERIYLKNGVFDLSYDNNTLLAIVSSNKRYNVSIYRTNNYYNLRCSCSKQSNCEHVYAACLQYKKVFDRLSRIDNSTDKQLIAFTEQLKRKPDRYSDVLIDIIRYLIDQNDDTLLSYINSLNQYNFNFNDRFIYLAMMQNDILRKRCIKLYENDLDNIENYNFIRNCVSYLHYKGNNNDLDYLFYNLDFSKLFTYLNTHRPENNQILYESKKIYDLVFESITIDDKDVDTFIEHCNESNRLSYFNYLFINKCNKKQREKILLQNDISIRFSYVNIADFNREDKEKMLEKVEFRDTDERVEVLKNEFDDIKDYRKAFSLLMRIKYDNNAYHVDDVIYTIAHKFKNNEYILNLLKNYDRQDEYDYYRYSYRRFRYQYEDDYFPYVEQKALNINSKAIDDYFDMNYKIERIDDRYVIHYYLNDPNSKQVYEISTVIDEENYNDEIDFFKVDECKFEDDDRDIANYIVYKIPSIYKQQYDKDIQNIRDSISDIVRKKKLKSVIEQMSGLYTNYINTSHDLSDDIKASLQYQFYIENLHGTIIYELSMKVGIKKFYVIKNMKDFLHKFKNEEIHSYGKELKLKHSLDNFNEIDKTNIKLLLTNDFTYSYNKNRQIINENLFEQLLYNLNQKEISIDDKKYLCNLIEKEYTPKLDKDYILGFDKDITDIHFLKLGNSIFLVDNNTDQINLLKCDRSNIDLMFFMYLNDGVCIKDASEEFKEKIYSIYYDQIDVDENIKNDYVIDNLKISAYFDYDNKYINLRSEYRINDNIVTKDKIKNQLDIIMKDNYLRYIDNLGFEDNMLKKDDDILNFFNMDFSALKRLCEVYLSENIQNKKITMFTPGKIHVSYNNNIMQAFLEESSYSDEELHEILKSIKRKKKYVLLSSDRIIDLSNEETIEFFDAINDLGLNEKKLSEPTTIPISKSLKAFAHENYCEVDEYLKNMIDDISNFKDSDYKLPELNGTLRTYQIEAYKWLRILCKYHVGGILADDMGLGKTIEIISLIASDKTKKPSLIVCPKSLIFNWKNEFTKFAPDEEVIQLYGDKKFRTKQIEDIDPKKKITYITSYESLNKDSALYENKQFNYLIIDEAQAIKNVLALKTQSVKNINADNKFALTGTPIENNIVDLWSIFDFVMPGYFSDLDEFKRKADNDKFISLLAKRIAPFVLRRSKKDVLKDLPEKYETIISCEMNSSQKKIYEAHKKLARDKLNEGSNAFDVLPYLMRLRQICVDPATFVDDYNGGSGKMDMLMELVKQYLDNGHRILIFSQFVKALNLVEELLHKNNIDYYMITGNTSAEKRVEIADSFNNDSKEKVLLISLKAGGTGLNLIGADTVIHLDPWWNVAAENQASDRSHRIGQTKNVEIIKLICDNSIEQRVIELQNIKKDLIDKLISNDDQSVVNASLEDIKFILD